MSSVLRSTVAIGLTCFGEGVRLLVMGVSDVSGSSVTERLMVSQSSGPLLERTV